MRKSRQVLNDWDGETKRWLEKEEQKIVRWEEEKKRWLGRKEEGDERLGWKMDEMIEEEYWEEGKIDENINNYI